jgi:hypothetical protein
MAFLPEEDAATIPPEQARELVARGLLSPQQPGLNLTGADTGGGGGGGGDQVKLPDVVRKVVGTREEVRDGRRVRVTTYDDGTEDVEDLGPASPTGRKETGRREEVRDGRRILVIEYDDGTTEETDLGPVQGGGKKVVSVNQILIGGRRILRTSYDDGTFTDEDLGEEEGVEGVDSAAANAAAIALAQSRENAFNIVNRFLQRAQLQGLEGNIRALLAQGIEDMDAILFNLRGTEQFKTRFKANTARAAKGLPELDPATYIGLEQQYATVLRSNRLPNEFYDSPDDFNALIEGDVSPAEFQQRIQEGFVKVRDADPQVLNTLRQFYPEVGNDENALAAYFIDPKRGAQALDRQVQAARIGARAQQQAGMGIGKLTAEELVSRGYTPEVAQGVFERVGQLAGLYQEMGGEQALSTEQKVGAAFGYNVQAQRELERRRAQRVGEFQAGGGFARTTGATSGTVETGVGMAQ